MAKRYYYDCPIEAAYMAKWHDIHFCNLVDILLTNLSEHKGKKFYIYPDSLPILEPQPKDKVGDDTSSHLVVSDEDYKKHLKDCDEGEFSAVFSVPLVSISQAKAWIASGRAVIEKRDGKPFFWPKEESDA